MACPCCGASSGAKKGIQGPTQPGGDFCLSNIKPKKDAPKKGVCKTRSRQEIAEKKCELENKELKKKLEECIKKFDTNCPDIMANLAKLNAYLEDKADDEVCYPKKEWPQCPPVEGPDPYEVPHPYLPGRTLFSKPLFKQDPVKVTVDGRMAEMNKPRIYYHEQPPLNVPPWVLPRYKSQELRGGLLYQGCQCWKKNGLQDDCPRWDCGGGRPECRVRPLPVCPPSMAPPICGVRKTNLYDGKPPNCAKERPPPPYAVHIDSPTKMVPNAPSVPCILHDD